MVAIKCNGTIGIIGSNNSIGFNKTIVSSDTIVSSGTIGYIGTNGSNETLTKMEDFNCWDSIHWFHFIRTNSISIG